MIKEKVDLLFTEDGEILFDEVRQDVELVYETELEILNQTILKRIQSNDEDWGIRSAIAANLSYLTGSARSDFIRTEAENLIFSALTHDGLIDSNSIEIIIDGFDENVLMISVILFERPGLQTNILNKYNIGITYDLRDNRCIPRVLNGIGVNDG